MIEKKRNPNCPCTYTGCRRHGNCEECRRYHRGRGEQTACERQRASKS